MLLSEYKGEKGIEKAAKLMPLIMQIRDNPKTREAWRKFCAERQADAEKIKANAESKKKSETAKADEAEAERRMGNQLYAYLSEMFANEATATLELFAILNDKDVSEYQADCASILSDMIDAVAFDTSLMSLFLRRSPRKIAPSSGAASENTEGAGK